MGVFEGASSLNLLATMPSNRNVGSRNRPSNIAY